LTETVNPVQVCLEGQLSRESAADGLTRGKRAAGDLIPWTIGQQFQDKDFPMLAGARVVRIATHPDYQGVSIARVASPYRLVFHGLPGLPTSIKYKRGLL